MSTLFYIVCALNVVNQSINAAFQKICTSTLQHAGRELFTCSDSFVASGASGTPVGAIRIFARPPGEVSIGPTVCWSYAEARQPLQKWSVPLRFPDHVRFDSIYTMF